MNPQSWYRQLFKTVSPQMTSLGWSHISALSQRTKLKRSPKLGDSSKQAGVNITQQALMESRGNVACCPIWKTNTGCTHLKKKYLRVVLKERDEQKVTLRVVRRLGEWQVIPSSQGVRTRRPATLTHVPCGAWRTECSHSTLSAPCASYSTSFLPSSNNPGRRNLWCKESWKRASVARCLSKYLDLVP